MCGLCREISMGCPRFVINTCCLTIDDKSSLCLVISKVGVCSHLQPRSDVELEVGTQGLAAHVGVVIQTVRIVM